MQLNVIILKCSQHIYICAHVYALSHNVCIHLLSIVLSTTYHSVLQVLSFFTRASLGYKDLQQHDAGNINDRCLRSAKLGNKVLLLDADVECLVTN